MRWGAMLVVVQLACLSSPPDNGADPSPACDDFGEWESEADTVLEGTLAVSPTVTADQTLLLYETLDGAIGIAERDGPDDPFAAGDETLVSAINSAEGERNPTLSADGLTVWFTRGSLDETELLVSHRDDGTDPFPLATEVTGLEGVHPEGPDVWDGGLELVYSIADPDHQIADARCPAHDRCSQLGVLEIGDDGNDWFPTIRGDGLEVVYRNEDTGMRAARRVSPDDPFEDHDLLDFAGDDPELSSDGRTLYFALAEQIYVTTRPCLDE